MECLKIENMEHYEGYFKPNKKYCKNNCPDRFVKCIHHPLGKKLRKDSKK